MPRRWRREEWAKSRGFESLYLLADHFCRYFRYLFADAARTDPFEYGNP